MRYLMIAAVLAAAASPAQAQPTPWQPERVTAGWVFTPSVAFGALWDDNATVQDNANPQIAELVGVFNPRAEIGFNGKRAKASAGYSGSLEAYREISELTRYDQRGRLDARYVMSPRLELFTRHQLTATPTTDQLELGGLPFTRIGSTMLDSRGGFTYRMSPRTKLTTDYNFQWVNFDRDSELASDFRLLQGGHAHSPAVEVIYSLSRRLDVGGSWLYRRASIDGGEQIVGTQQALGLVEFTVGPYTKVQGKGGFAYLSIDGDEETETGPSFGGGVTHKAGRTELGASFERTFVPSFGFGGATAFQLFNARATTQFAGGRMYASGSFTYRRNDPFLFQGLTIQLDSYWTQGSVAYFVARWLRVEGFVAVTHQTSSAQGNVDRTRIGIQFVTFKPVRIQ